MTDELHDLAPFYVLDGLDEAGRARFEAHLAGCAQCRAEVAELSDTLAAMDIEPAESIPDEEPLTRRRPDPMTETGLAVGDEPGSESTSSGAGARSSDSVGGATVEATENRHIRVTRRLSVWLTWAAVMVAVVAAILIMVNR